MSILHTAALIGLLRNHRQLGSLFMLNVLLGWTTFDSLAWAKYENPVAYGSCRVATVVDDFTDELLTHLLLCVGEKSGALEIPSFSLTCSKSPKYANSVNLEVSEYLWGRSGATSGITYRWGNDKARSRVFELSEGSPGRKLDYVDQDGSVRAEFLDGMRRSEIFIFRRNNDDYVERIQISNAERRAIRDFKSRCEMKP